MKWKKGVCLLAVLMLSVPSISYAEEQDGRPGSGTQQEAEAEQESGRDAAEDIKQNNEDNSESETEFDTGNDVQQDGLGAEEQNLAEPENNLPIDDNSDYVVWGRGRGITPSTLNSDNDRFSTISNGISIVSIDPSLKSRLDAYVKDNGLQSAEIIDKGQLANT